MTPEAILVSQLDNLDAKLTMSLCSVDPDGEGRSSSGKRLHGAGGGDRLASLQAGLSSPINS